jgi:ribosomal protein S18 acetylase RimI-like enzyme
MNDPQLRSTLPVIFDAGAWHACELGAEHIPLLQAFFVANPEYFEQVHGESPRVDEAQLEFDDLPPPGMPYTRRWILGFITADGEIQGIVSVLEDLFAPQLGHIGLFVVAAKLHGSGAAQTMLAALERWLQERGARWLRLGVVIGNDRAMRFWQRQGYEELRVREGVPTGPRMSHVSVRMKCLGDATVKEHLQRVARDRPDAI